MLACTHYLWSLWRRLLQRSGLPTPRKGLVTQARRGFSAPSPDGDPAKGPPRAANGMGSAPPWDGSTVPRAAAQLPPLGQVAMEPEVSSPSRPASEISEPRPWTGPGGGGQPRTSRSEDALGGGRRVRLGGGSGRQDAQGMKAEDQRPPSPGQVCRASEVDYMRRSPASGRARAALSHKQGAAP